MDETINKSLMGSQFPHNFNNSIKLIFKFFLQNFQVDITGCTVQCEFVACICFVYGGI